MSSVQLRLPGRVAYLLFVAAEVLEVISWVALSYFLAIVFFFLPINITLLQQGSDALQPPSINLAQRAQYTQEAQTVIFDGRISSLLYDFDEVGHLLDVRKVFFTVVILLIAVLILLFFLYLNKIPYRFHLRSRLFTIVATMLTVLTLLSAAFFPIFFTIVHVVLFPQGNFTFPETSPLIQAFPVTFWFLAFLSLQATVILVTILQAILARQWEARQFSRPISQKVQ